MRAIAVLFCVLLSAGSYAAEFRPGLRQIADISAGKNVYTADRKSAILNSLALGNTVPSEILLFGKGDASALRKYGAKVQTRAGKYFTAIVQVSSLSALKEEKAIDFLDYGPPLKPLMDAARPYVSADQSSAAGYRGDDVIIGVVDSGIDISHPDFQTDNGLTRILYLWDQTDNGDAPPEFDYGTEWTKMEIDNGLCTEKDLESQSFHGTHVTGIAAGNGKQSSGLYTGVSPRANIIFVKSKMTMNSVLDGVNYIFFMAKQLNKPCVINISLGNQYGSHTEYDDFNQAMDEIVDYYGRNGHIIVWAAGNDGTYNGIHSKTWLSTVSNVCIPFNHTSGTAQLYFWHDSTNGLTISVSNNGSAVLGFTNTSAFSFISKPNLEVESYSDTAGEKCIALTVTPTGSATWTLTIQANPTTNAVDGYVLDYSGYCNFSPYETSGILTGQACQKLGFSVGALVTRRSFTNYLGTIYTSGTLNQIANFSSRGPTRDNKNKPEICAPGSYLIAPLAYEHNTVTKVNDYYRADQGTSMAAPMVTGIIAQLLEKEPGLTADDIRQYFMNYTKLNAYKTSRTWDVSYGYGIADLAFLTTVNAAQAKLDVSLKNNVLNVTGDKDNTLYVLFRSNSSQIGSTVHAAIYDKNGGLVRDFGSERISSVTVKEYSWNGKDQFSRTARPGLYFLQVTVDNASSRYPLLIVR